MLDNDNKNSEINLNLKVPPEQSDGNFSMKDLVLTLYNARKIFITWCCIGLLLGIVAAGTYYITQNSNSPPVTIQGDVSVTLTLNYYGAEWNIFPNGATFNAKSFSEPIIWKNALNTVNCENIKMGDVINEVAIRNKEGTYNVFILTISSDSTVFESNDLKKEFLQALCSEYKNFIINKYFIKENIGVLYSQYLRTWIDICSELIWSPFNFDNNLSALTSRYSALEGILTNLYNNDPAYSTSEGKSFDDYSQVFKDIRTKDIAAWTTKLQYNIYIRNIDRFKEEVKYRLDTMERNRKYNLELVASYSDLLASFQQKDSQGVIIQEAVNILANAQIYAANAADLQRQINQMEYNLAMLTEIGEPILRENSREAEAALTNFIKDLEANQEKLRKIIYEYYEKVNEREAENSVIYSNSVIIADENQPIAVAGVSKTRLLMIFAGLTFVGAAVGFCAAFVKKYLPEKEEQK
jgi:hypothetical protein